MISNMRTSWAALKSKELPIRYTEAQGNYYIYCNSEVAEYCCVVSTASVDGADFSTNYMSQSTGV